MKVAYVSSDYHWKSYSVVRCLYEAMCKDADLDVVLHKTRYNPGNDDRYGLVILAGVQAERKTSTDVPVIRIGFSDPNLYDAKKAKDCDLYFTNDIELGRREKHHYLPCFADHYHFRQVPGVKKDITVLFVGVGTHPYVTDRISTIDALRKKGHKISVYGEAWPEHEDNHGFVEGSELIEVINRSRLMLDITNKTSALSSRIFQAAACGVPAVTLDRQDTNTLFNTTEIFTYTNRQNLCALLTELFERPSILAEFGRNAYHRFLANHTAVHRVAAIKEALHDKNIL